MLVDVAASFGLTGRQAEAALRECGITLNRNSLPFDTNGPWYTSGLRLGTPAVTTLGMGADEMREIARGDRRRPARHPPVVRNGKPSKAKYATERTPRPRRSRGSRRCAGSPQVYPEIDLSILEPGA